MVWGLEVSLNGSLSMGAHAAKTDKSCMICITVVTIVLCLVHISNQMEGVCYLNRQDSKGWEKRNMGSSILQRMNLPEVPEEACVKGLQLSPRPVLQP